MTRSQRTRLASALMLGFWTMLIGSLIEARQVELLQFLGGFFLLLMGLIALLLHASPHQVERSIPVAPPACEAEAFSRQVRQESELAELILMCATVTVEDRERALLV